MAATDNIAFAVAAWIIAAGCSVAAARISRRSQSGIDLLAVGFLSGCVSFAVIGYYVRTGRGVHGSEWYYLAWSVPIGLFAHKVYGFIDRRSDQILRIILARFGLNDVGEDKKRGGDTDHGSGILSGTGGADPLEERPRPADGSDPSGTFIHEGRGEEDREPGSETG